MIRFIPCSTNNVAVSLSTALWCLAKPTMPEDTTCSMFGTIIDLQNNSWLEIDDEFAVILHSSAVLGSIAEILQPWIDDGYLPVNTNTQLESLINSKRGKSLIIYDVIPQFFKDQSKSYEAMISNNLLPPKVP